MPITSESLHPGAVRVDKGKNVLDYEAIAGSMALAIEQEMDSVYFALNNQPMPPVLVGGKDVGKDGRRLLFVAIARGVMKYLKDHEHNLVSDVTTVAGKREVSDLTLNIDMSR